MRGFGRMLVSPSARHRSVPSAASAMDFDALVVAAGFDTHWRLNETSGTTAADSIGSKPGTIVGNPRLGVDSLINSDRTNGGKSIAFDGSTQWITRDNLITTGGGNLTISKAVQFDRVKDKHVLFAVGDGLTDGHLSFEVVDDGTGGMRFRQFTRGADSYNVWLTDLGTVPAPGTSALVTYRQTSHASLGKREILVDGIVVAGGTNTDILEPAAPPAGTWYFFAYTNQLKPFDGVAAEVMAAASVISDLNLQLLSLAANVVWLADFDAGSVVASTTKTIDLEPISHPSSGFTVTALSNGSLGTAAANGEDLNFTAGGSTGNDDTCTAKITFGGQDSRTATFTIDVAASGGGATPLSHWLLDETTGATAAVDSKAVQNAIIRGEPFFQQSPLKGSDHGIATWGGPEVIEIPHNDAYVLTAATFAFSVQPVAEPVAEMRHTAQILAQREDYWENVKGAFIVKRVNGLLDVGVRNSSGTMQWAGGGTGTGIAGATLPLGTAKLGGITFGPAGAKVYLNGAKVGNTLSTANWDTITASIFVGRGMLGDEPAHAVFDDIRIYGAQLTDAEMATLGSASSITPNYGTPAQPPGTLFRVENYGASPGGSDSTTAFQNAILAAAAAGGGVVTCNSGNQSFWDSTTGQVDPGNYFTVGQTYVPPIVSLWRLPVRKIPHSTEFSRLFLFGNSSLAPDNATRPNVYIRECYLNGQQTLVPDVDGLWNGSFTREQQHLLFMKKANEATPRHVYTIDHNHFRECCGDGISAGAATDCTVDRMTYVSCFRGGPVVNEGRAIYNEKNARIIDGDYGSGVDVEIFAPFDDSTQISWVNVWMESDLDFNGGGGAGNANKARGSILADNFVSVRGAFNVINNGTNATNSTITIKNSILGIGNASGSTSDGSRMIQPSDTILIEDSVLSWSDLPHKKHPSTAPPNDKSAPSPLRCNVNWNSQPGLLWFNRVKMVRVRDVTNACSKRTALPCSMFTTSGSPSSSMIVRAVDVDVDNTISAMNHGGARMEHHLFRFRSGSNAFTGTGQQVAI